MTLDAPILVIDTNTMVRAFSNWGSPSGIVVTRCEKREWRLLLSKPVLTEYREVLAYQKITIRNPSITPVKATKILGRLRFGAEYCSLIGVRFRLVRDPDDEKFLELAIAGKATHIVTHDHDLLSLPTAHTDAAKRLRQRLPRLKIVTADAFLRSVKGGDN